MKKLFTPNFYKLSEAEQAAVVMAELTDLRTAQDLAAAMGDAMRRKRLKKAIAYRLKKAEELGLIANAQAAAEEPDDEAAEEPGPPACEIYGMDLRDIAHTDKFGDENESMFS